MKLLAKIAIGIAAVLAIAAIGGFVWLNQEPAAPATLDEAVSVERRERNSEIQFLLYGEGFSDSMVDLTEERLYVAYELPPTPEGHDPGTPWEVEAQETLMNFLLSEGYSSKVLLLQYQGEAAALYWKFDATRVKDGEHAHDSIEKKDFRASD